MAVARKMLNNVRQWDTMLRVICLILAALATILIGPALPLNDYFYTDGDGYTYDGMLWCAVSLPDQQLMVLSLLTSG
jgi:hypothetical protein